MAEIIIDNRETQLIKLLSESTNFTSKNLDLGDIEFYHEKEFVLLLERKTIADLAASLKDGRYHEQKARITSLRKQKDAPMVGYLIEGRIYPKVGGITENALMGAIVNTFVRDRIVVFRTFSIEETVKFLLKMKEKIDLFGLNHESFTETSELDYLSTISKVKKANMTVAMCYRSQLCQIPGVSAAIANEIFLRYPSFVFLMEAYRNLKSDKEKHNLLAKIVISSTKDTLLHSNKKGRRIGPVVSHRIYKYLLGIK